MIEAMFFVGVPPHSQERLLQVFACLPPPLKADMQAGLRGCRWHDSIFPSALHHGLIDRVLPSDPEIDLFRQLAKKNEHPLLAAIDLAHPALTEESLALLREATNLKTATRTAISLNPNVAASHKFRGLIFKSPEAFMVTACARHGDTFDPRIVNVLKKGLFSGMHGASDTAANYRSICSRQDLSPAIVLALAEHVSGEAYWDLMQNPENRKICKVQDGQPIESYFGPSGLRLHPEISTPTLEKIFASLDGEVDALPIPDMALGMAQVAAHPNGHEAMVDRLVKGTDKRTLSKLLSTFRDTPLEEKMTEVLIQQANAGFDRVSCVADCSSGALERAYQKVKDQPKLLTGILSHKNFPWKNHSENEVVAGLRGGVIPAIRAARLLADGGPNEELSMRNRDDALILLFDPRLSSRRVGMIAEKHPDCAVFAAIHPNAENIAVPAEHDAL